MDPVVVITPQALSGLTAQTLSVGQSNLITLLAARMTDKDAATAQEKRDKLDKLRDDIREHEKKVLEAKSQLYNEYSGALTTIVSAPALGGWLGGLVTPVLKNNWLDLITGNLGNAAFLQLMMPTCPGCQMFAAPFSDALASLGIPSAAVAALDVSCLRTDPTCALSSFIKTYFNGIWDGLVPAVFSIGYDAMNGLMFSPLGLSSRSSVDVIRSRLRDAMAVNGLAKLSNAMKQNDAKYKQTALANQAERLDETQKSLEKALEAANTAGVAKQRADAAQLATIQSALSEQDRKQLDATTMTALAESEAMKAMANMALTLEDLSERSLPSRYAGFLRSTPFYI